MIPGLHYRPTIPAALIVATGGQLPERPPAETAETGATIRLIDDTVTAHTLTYCTDDYKAPHVPLGPVSKPDFRTNGTRKAMRAAQKRRRKR